MPKTKTKTRRTVSLKTIKALAKKNKKYLKQWIRSVKRKLKRV
jgi:hypothetical protein